MKLRKIFQTKNGAFREAVRTDDLELMKKIMAKRSEFLIFELFNADNFKDMTPRMAELFVAEASPQLVARWSFKPGTDGSALLNMLILHAAEQKRYDLLDIYFNGKTDYCKGGDGGALLAYLIGKDDLTADKKHGYVRKILAGGSKLKDADSAIAAAIDKEDLTALDILAAAGIDLGANNQHWLRAAAKQEKRPVCLHLAEKHGGDIGRAVETARALGTHDAAVYLAALREEIRPAADIPPTVESLSKEVRELRAAMQELTLLVREMQGAGRLDKPGIARLSPRGGNAP